MQSDPTDAGEFRNGQVSFWYRHQGLPGRRAPLPGDVTVDVAVAGAGLTGLWTAYYLKRARPELRIAVLERAFAGFGASGRNAGWLSAEPPGQLRRYAKAGGVPAARSLQRHMFSAIDEVIEVAAAEGIEADIVKSGLLYVATNPAQESRLLQYAQQRRREGWTEADLHTLGAGELAQRVRIAGARSAMWTPHCARIQPAKLVLGLAAAVENLGVRIYENTTVTGIDPGVVSTDRGRVQANIVVQALEGYGGQLPGQRRRIMPMNSSMLITEPLPERVWHDIGWRGAELLADHAHSFTYSQRTADGRIVIGGRGVPYNFGSRIEPDGRTAERTVGALTAALHRMFPAVAGHRIAHSWSGVLGVPRDWCASVRFDPHTGLGSAGGYVGHGVAATNLAGRSLRDLVLGEDSELVRLPWVNRAARRWEREPLRWLGIRGLYVAYRAADRFEAGSGSNRTAILARVANMISGR